MFNIKLVNKISPAGLDNFDKSKYICADDVTNVDAVLVRSASMHESVLEPSLKAIARAGAGVNNIPVDKCSKDGIVVFNTPGANANAVKELVLAGLLLSARKIIPSIEWVQTLAGKGAEVPKMVESGKSQFVGPELTGKKLGIIGLGAIGVLVANAARHFGMEIYGYDPYLSIDTAWSLSHEIKKANSLKEIYENCDFISIHVPATSETKGMINSQSISMMKHGVRILNFSRSELVDTQDILAALDDKTVRCYITDFPLDEYIEHPGVICIPHLGASTPESEDNCARMAAIQVIDFLENGNIKNSVNFPNIEMSRSGNSRICVVHENVPNMISQITGTISKTTMNIENMMNKSKKEIAYTMVDISGNITDELVNNIRSIDGVVRVNLH